MRTSLRSKVLAAAAASSALVALATGPARAADTTTTFTLTGDGLTISAPASKNLSVSTTIGTAGLSGELGAVTVTDLRGQMLVGWTATAISIDFETDDGGPNEVIAASNVSYWSGAATLTGGTALAVGQQATSVNKVAINTAKAAVINSLTTGSSVVTWTPTLEVAVPDNVLAGTYTGTITHSVA